MRLDATSILDAVGNVLAEERSASVALAARLAEFIDEYGNVMRQPGPPGAAGAPGEPGPVGDPGRDGAPGARGEPGLMGPPGPAGVPGERGPQGDPGRDGRDGRQENLANGGWTGQRGAPGAPGERGATGEPAYPGRACGLYSATETYREMDVVAFNGSEWRAARNEPGPLPGDGWVLGAKGSRGKPGEPGPRGEKGERGDPGAAIVEAVVSDAMELILLRSDGTALTCSLLPAFERYHREVAAQDIARGKSVSSITAERPRPRRRLLEIRRCCRWSRAICASMALMTTSTSPMPSGAPFRGSSG